MEKKKVRNQTKKLSSPPRVKFPLSLLKPIAEFLKKESEDLEKKQKELKKADPFSDVDRVIDNAASDTEATEQFVHQQKSALQAEINRRLIQIRKALTRIKIGKYGICEKCGQMIDTDRLMIMPEATLCASCAKKKEE
ncbi:MAG: TraR/DksA C4-type zinc finger protein [Microgenomates group bacterium]